jgi:hypothetical protein
MQKAADIGEIRRTELGAQLHVMTSAMTGIGIRHLFEGVAISARGIFKNDAKVTQIQTTDKSAKGGCC